MSFLRDTRTTLSDQDAFWRKWVSGERKLQGTSYSRAQTSMSTRRSKSPSVRDDLRIKADELRKKNDVFYAGNSFNSGNDSRRSSLAPIRDSLGYRSIRDGTAGGGFHMYPKTSLHETLHQLPPSARPSLSFSETIDSSLADLSEMYSSQDISPEVSRSFEPCWTSGRPPSPQRVTLIPRSSSPVEVEGGGLAIVGGSAQLGFRAAGRAVSTQIIRPPSPPRTQLSSVDDNAPGVYADVWRADASAASRAMAYEQESMRASDANTMANTRASTSLGFTDPGGRSFGKSWHGWRPDGTPGNSGAGYDGASMTGLQERIMREELLRAGAISSVSNTQSPSKDLSVSLKGQTVRINTSNVKAVNPAAQARNWSKFATNGPVVDLCSGPDALLRDRLRMMQEGYVGKVKFTNA